jgi:pilus assembly protein CpaE
MSGPIRTLVALDQGADRTVVETALPSVPGIQVLGVIDGLDESWSALQETPADVVVVATPGYSERALVFIEGSVRQQPNRPVVVLSQGSPNGFIRRVFESGADDVATLPAGPQDIAFLLQKVVARREGTAVSTGTAQAPLICVLGPKGGTGKTLTAGNLAVGIADDGYRVVAVDIDLQFGDLGLSLGLSPEKTLSDLARSAGTLDADKIEGFLAKHESGARILMAPTRPDHAGAVTVEFLRDVYSTLRNAFDYVIVDTPPGFTPEVIATIDMATEICVVGMLDSLSLKNTKLGLETLDLMGYDQDRVRIVLNRADSRVGITRDDVGVILGRIPDVLIPSDREIPRAVNEGTPIVHARRRSEAAKAFRSLATMVEHKPAADTGSRRGLLRRKS